MEEEVSSSYIGALVNVDADPIDIEHETDKLVTDLEKKIDEPKEGMEFDSVDELMAFYTMYAKEIGFAVAKRSSKKVGGVLRHVHIECTRAGVTKIASKNPLQMRPNSKINCQAMLKAVFSRNEKWCVTVVKLAHNYEMKEANCNCQLFGFRGIMCRHQLMVFAERHIIDEVPAKYILHRWSKNVKRGHTKIRIGYDNWSDRPEARRFDKFSHVFSEVCDLVVDSETLYDEVLAHALQMKERYKEMVEIGGSKMPIPTSTHMDSTSHGDGIGISKESTNILDPLVTRSTGRPPSKRKVGNVEKAIKKKSTAKKKTSTSNTRQGYEEQGNAEHGTFGSVVLNSSFMQPNIHTPLIPQPAGVGIGGNFACQPNFGLGGNFAFQPNLGNFAIQGYQNPFWRMENDFTNMHPSSSDRGVFPEDNDR